ncbi:hypothetical protein PFISCL1PPCAC_22058 [Pristionchus fissidentatus]|uniref:Uncharacterized protein n=1 Tax=Pristionchus fissidentatus TaxID=1538716 RepID=A0AAV5WFQ8_9BILA|nr:hypothetical protein PFISCL1PPCAC_22058 [Pristionchus fissidentatus]
MFVQWINKWDVKEFGPVAQNYETMINRQSTFGARLLQSMSRIYTVSLIVGSAFHDGQISRAEGEQIQEAMQMMSPAETRIFNEVANLAAQQIAEEQNRLLINQPIDQIDNQAVEPDVSGGEGAPIIEQAETPQDQREEGGRVAGTEDVEENE